MQQSRILVCLALAAAAAAFSLPSTAQVQSAGSWLPYTGRGYLGLSVGHARYRMPCGTTTLTCDNTETPAQIYLRSRIGNFWGVELGYLDMGRVNRAGTDARTQGLNLSVVGRAPLGKSFGVFGKIGTLYGRTESTALLSSGAPAGAETGFGVSYGAGVSYDFTARLSATLALDSYDFRFAGKGRDPVRSASLGLQYRY